MTDINFLQPAASPAHKRATQAPKSMPHSAPPTSTKSKSTPSFGEQLARHQQSIAMPAKPHAVKPAQAQSAPAAQRPSPTSNALSKATRSQDREARGLAAEVPSIAEKDRPSPAGVAVNASDAPAAAAPAGDSSQTPSAPSATDQSAPAVEQLSQPSSQWGAAAVPADQQTGQALVGQHIGTPADVAMAAAQLSTTIDRSKTSADGGDANWLTRGAANTALSPASSTTDLPFGEQTNATTNAKSNAKSNAQTNVQADQQDAESWLPWSAKHDGQSDRDSRLSATLSSTMTALDTKLTAQSNGVELSSLLSASLSSSLSSSTNQASHANDVTLTSTGNVAAGGASHLSAAAADHVDSALSPFSTQFGERFALKVGQTLLGGLDRAEIRLSPQELGPIHLRIDVSGAETRITINASHPETIQAVERSVPLLRHLLAEQGLKIDSFDLNPAAPSLATSGSASGGTAWAGSGSHGQAPADPFAARSTAAPQPDNAVHPAELTPRPSARRLLNVVA